VESVLVASWVKKEKAFIFLMQHPLTDDKE